MEQQKKQPLSEPDWPSEDMVGAFALLREKVPGLGLDALPHFYFGPDPTSDEGQATHEERNRWLAARLRVLVCAADTQASAVVLTALVRLVLRPGTEPNGEPLQHLLLALFGAQPDKAGLDEFEVQCPRLLREAEGYLLPIAGPDSNVVRVLQGGPKERQVGGDHYRSLAIQPIEYILANGLGFVEGNVLKYITRYSAKNGVEDLQKARHYLDLLISQLEEPPA